MQPNAARPIYSAGSGVVVSGPRQKMLKLRTIGINNYHVPTRRRIIL
jgi:hypothetical protein